MADLKKGKIYTGQVEKMVYGGKGIVRIDDFVVFVDKAVTGQKIEFQITKLKKTYAYGKLEKVIAKAPNEILAKCKYFGECGGCKWQHLPYEAQLQIKAEIVKAEIDNVIQRKSYNFEQIISSPKIWNYRNKLDFSFVYVIMQIETEENGRSIYFDLNPCLGFHRPKKFELILPINHCEIAPQQANQVLNILQKFRAKHNLSVYNPKTHQGFLRNVIVRIGEKTGEVLVQIVVNFEEVNNSNTKADKNLLINKKTLWTELVAELQQILGIKGILLTHNRSFNDAVIDGYTEILWGKDHFFDQISDLKFQISSASFFQTNTLGAEKLYQTVKEYADLSGKENIIDLYCGTGTIGLFLADRAQNIYGIEVVSSAIENAKINAQLNGITNAHFVCGNIDKDHKVLLQQMPDSIDVLILDPPRAGIGKKALQTILDLKAKKIVYVSCNPTTFARDLEVALSYGYILKRVRPVDMFPHTHHIELVAELIDMN